MRSDRWTWHRRCDWDGVRYPAVPPALVFLAGCAFGSMVPVEPRGAAAVLWLTCAAAVVGWRSQSASAFAAAALVGFWSAGAGLGSAAAWEAAHSPLRAALGQLRGPEAVGDTPLDPVIVRGRLTEDAARSSSGVRLAIAVDSLEDRGRVEPARGGVLVTVTGEADPAVEATWRRGRLVSLPVLLRRPARYLNPGMPDHEAALARRGVTLVGFAKSGFLVRVVEPGSLAAEAASSARAWARRLFDSVVGSHDPRSSAILRAVILGDRAGLDDETELRLQEAGTYHVLAISGGNIAILAGLLVGLGRLLAVRRGVSYLAVAAALVGYAYLVGGGASVSRATAMAVIYLMAHAIDHRARPINILAASAGAAGVWNPLVLYDTGAWLTYGATLAIVAGTPLMLAWVEPATRLGRAAFALLAASCAAEVALFPIGALAFSRVTAAGLLVNFAAIPLMTLVQISGMGMLAAAAVAPAAVPVLGRVAHLSAWGLVESARLVDVAPWLTTRLAPPGLAVVVTYYAAWAAWWAARQSLPEHPRWGTAGRVTKQAAAALILATGVWVIAAPALRAELRGELEVTFIDVGQGDATLVRFPGGQTMLVDAGGAGGGSFDVGRRVIEPVIWARGVRRISRLVLTHADADHAGGAPAVLHDLSPPEVWEGVPVPPDPLLTEIRRTAEAAGSVWRAVQRGDLAWIGGVGVAVWHPSAVDWERQRVRNDDSVVVELRFGDVSIVLPGDIEASGEAAVAERLPPAPIRILQAPHHGSATSSSLSLIRAARPGLVVVSAGRGNRYGHPHRAVLDRYRAEGVPVMRTDRDGAITVRTDGRTARVVSFTGRRVLLGPATDGERARRP